MKQKTSTPTAQMEQSTPTRTTLFKSIVDNENNQIKEFECNRLANRVVIIKKILVNRNLDVLNWEFDSKLNDIIEDFANRIDNELYSTKKDS